MVKNKIILQDQQDLIPSNKKYQDNINLFINSPKDLIEGTILFTTDSEVYIDFGTKSIIKVPKKIYLKNLIQIFIILNSSYLLTKRSEKNSNLSQSKLKLWLKNKLKKGQKIKLKVNSIDSIKNIYTIDFKKTLEYFKYTKFFLELDLIKKSGKLVKGYVTNSIKGGFSVAIGGLIAFLPAKQLMKTPNRKLAESFINSSMNFKISKINFKNKNIVLLKA